MRCLDLNAVLANLCKYNGFKFIDNTAITSEHVYDGVHLNDEGSTILSNNKVYTIQSDFMRRLELCIAGGVIGVVQLEVSKIFSHSTS